jgi:predicted nucleic acid-binding protein
MARRRQATAAGASERLILDSAVIIAWSKGEPRARALVAHALTQGLDTRVPVAVLAETLRGGLRDAPVHRVLNAIDVFSTSPSVGRLAGELLGRAGSSNTVDAMVVAEAIEAGGATILTGDRDDLITLSARHPDVTIRAL